VHGGGVPEGVWRYVLGPQRWHGFGRCLHVGGELEPDPRGAERKRCSRGTFRAWS
jgi:hypothetical protein